MIFFIVLKTMQTNLYVYAMYLLMLFLHSDHNLVIKPLVLHTQNISTCFFNSCINHFFLLYILMYEIYVCVLVSICFAMYMIWDMMWSNQPKDSYGRRTWPPADVIYVLNDYLDQSICVNKHVLQNFRTQFKFRTKHCIFQRNLVKLNRFWRHWSELWFFILIIS